MPLPLLPAQSSTILRCNRTEEQQTQHHDPKLANRALRPAGKHHGSSTSSQLQQALKIPARYSVPSALNPASAPCSTTKKKLPVRHGATMIRTAISICTSHATTTLNCCSTTTATAHSAGRRCGKSVALPNAASAGASWADYDNDGWPDLWRHELGHQHIVSQSGRGKASPTSSIAPVSVNVHKNGKTASWGDYDSDGYLDLYIANWACVPRCARPEQGGDADRLTTTMATAHLKT